MKSLTFFSTLTVILLSFTGNLAAYEILTLEGRELKWRGNSLTFHVHVGSIPEGSSPWWLAVDRATQRFNDNPSNFSLALTPDIGRVGLLNTESEIWGSNSIAAPAATYPWALLLPIPFPPFHIVAGMAEADIVINNDGSVNWTEGSWKGALRDYGGIYRSLIGTGLHEMGHAVGLAHVNYEYNIMGNDWSHVHVNHWTARHYFGEDGADGLVHLYGLDSQSREDVGVVHWKYAGADGEYSDHTKTELFNTANVVLPSVGVDYDGDGDIDERHYRVSPNQQVRVKFSYENNGAHTQTGVRVGFFLSTSDHISTWDTRIGGATLDLGRNAVYTARHTVRLPSSLLSGQRYWIGAVIDETDSVSESVEWNNATYIPIVVN